MSHDWTHIPSLQEFEDGDIISATEMNDLHDEIKNSVNDFVDEVDAVVNVIEEDIDDLEELTTGHSATLTQHGLDISVHTSMLSSHTSTLSNHGSRLTSVEANQEIDEGNIEELGIRMTDAEEAIDDLETLTAQHTTTIANHSTRLTDVENAQETDADNIELITERLGNAEDDIDDLEGDVATVKSTVSSHTSTLSSHTSTLTEHGNRLTQDGEYIIALEEAMTELAGNISDLDGNVTELSEEVSDLNTDLNTLASKKAGTTLGLVKASTAQATDTQPVRITNDGYLVTAPGGEETEIFRAEYGITTYDEIEEANDDGKIVIVDATVDGVERRYRLFKVLESGCVFGVFEANTFYYVTCKNNNSWVSDENTFLYSGNTNIREYVKTGLTTGGTWTTAEQQAARQLIGLEKEWVLIGAISGNEGDRGNIDTGITVNLNGYTEIVVRGDVVGDGSGDVFLGTLADYLAGSVVTTGNGSRRTIRVQVNDDPGGYVVSGQYHNSTGAVNVSYTMQYGYSRMDGKRLAAIQKIHFINSTRVLQCDVEIYAR